MPPPQSYSGDAGDEQGGDHDQCQQEIEELEDRVEKIEKMLGIQSPPDDGDQDPNSQGDGLSQAIAGNANPFLKAKSL